MGWKGKFIGLAGCLFASTCAVAGTMGPAGPSYHFVAAVLGGYANVRAGDSQDFYATNVGAFIYSYADAGIDDGFIGGFLGIERALSYEGFVLQLGAEYDAFGSVQVNGLHFVGATPPTYTRYNFNYDFQTQQVLGVIKLMGTTHERFHPYGAVGLGAAFNKFSNFMATTTQAPPVNLAPMYADTSTTSFSYTVGLGVETDLYKHLRLGLGYRFSSFGKADFGNGTVTVNNFTATTPFNLQTSNAFANQFLAQISFVA